MSVRLQSALLGVCPSGQRERAVNPSAQPTEVRILPPPLGRRDVLDSRTSPRAQRLLERRATMLAAGSRRSTARTEVPAYRAISSTSPVVWRLGCASS